MDRPVSSKKIETGGGAFDPSEAPIYFIASSMEALNEGIPVHSKILVAVNELNTPQSRSDLDSAMESGATVFLDSGVYNLAMEHARKYGVSHDVGLSMAPEDIHGFDALYDSYIELVKHYESRLWGYIEIDQGGRERKIETRAKLESAGLRPVPVYHPLTDGWDYFEFLAERYDRICLGNIVQAQQPVRKRLLATLWQRGQSYPDLWVHVLGLSMHPSLCAYPVNSIDSSTWLSAVRWTKGYRDKVCLGAFGSLPKEFTYTLDRSQADQNPLYKKAKRMAAYGEAMNQKNWRHYLSEFK